MTNGASILFGTGILLAVALAWFILYYWLNPHVSSPDGKARVIGSCGDIMEIRLRFEKGCMIDGSSWTNGCAYSLNCVLAAVDLARNKTPEEILDVDSAMIRKAVGGLPKDHWHCSTLATDTLHAAIDDYMQAGLKKTMTPSISDELVKSRHSDGFVKSPRSRLANPEE
ncbi:iron-sulfur cluster assembly protein, NifU-like [Desulfosarcina variabilis str. Montpellier]|uniref:iron-sulfur cluster assembly scaffold protein n=1 Tax=Desulfosarcina variabilis TaxID=2300 RepID=UPI003AFA1F1A